MSRAQRITLAIAVVAAVAGAYGLGRYHSRAVGNRSSRHVLYYVDPMHPAYKSDKPGVAPDCGMALEPVYADDAANARVQSVHVELPPGTVSVDSATQRLLGIRVATVEKGGSARVIHAVGRVVPEDTLVYRLNSGVDGYIQETSGDAVGTEVKKDQRLASYYSPDFLAVASGFLAANERVPGANGNDGARTVPFPGAVSKQGVSSLQGYTDRLRNLGMSDVQIKRVADSRQLPENIDVVSPVDGFILARNITPGMHFDHGMEFYRIADLHRVWVVAEVSEQDASYVQSGGAAQVLLNDGARIAAHITDSLPQSEAGGGTVKLRVEVENPKYVLRPDMLADVELPVRLPPGITVPVDALVDSGSRARVYVERSEGVFEPREVVAGWHSGERVQILKGVQPGERVVVGATFLVDSESRLKAPDASATPAYPGSSQRASVVAGRGDAPEMVKDPSCGMSIDRAKAEAAGNTVSVHGETYYFCSTKCKEKFQNTAASASRTSPTKQPGS